MTASSKATHWASINETSFVLGMRVLFWVCRLFGRWPFRMALFPVLLWQMSFHPGARRASMAYLRRVKACGGNLPAGSLALSVVKHFTAFGECVLDKMLVWGGLIDIAKIRCFGDDILDSRDASQAGGVIMCAHFGNLELSRVAGKQRKDLKLTVLVHTKHAEKFNRMLAQLDPSSQVDLFQVTEMTPATAMLLQERVARGEFVVIAGDRIPVSANPRVAMARFLGEQAPFPVGAYVLASLLQCPLYLMFSWRGKEAYEIHFERFRDSIRLPRKERESALAELAQAYAARLEHYCLRAPLQWFNFFDFWQLPESHNQTAHP